jgi:hypothetical protein
VALRLRREGAPQVRTGCWVSSGAGRVRQCPPAVWAPPGPESAVLRVAGALWQGLRW